VQCCGRADGADVAEIGSASRSDAVDSIAGGTLALAGEERCSALGIPSFTVLPAGSKPARMNEITALTSAG
jgi:hypothetical protein